MSWAEDGGWVGRLLVRIWDGPLPHPDEALAVHEAVGEAVARARR